MRQIEIHNSSDFINILDSIDYKTFLKNTAIVKIFDIFINLIF